MIRVPLLLLSAVLLVAGAVRATPLRGTDPAVYLRNRTHTPTVTAELARLPEDVALQIARHPEHVDAFLVGDVHDPIGLDAAERAQLRAGEREALLVGALARLGHSTAADATALLVGYVHHTSSRVRVEAALHLGERRADAARSTSALRDAATHDADTAVRAAACAGLATLGTAEAAAALVDFAADADDGARRLAALRALPRVVRIPAAAAAVPAARALTATLANDGDSDVRAAAAELAARLP